MFTVKIPKESLNIMGLHLKKMQAEAEKVTMSITELVELKLALESLSDLELIIVQQKIIGNEKLETISQGKGIFKR
ncbi:MAG: hypothetical protein GXY08_10595 [Ruminococcus sp.]|nr:hypothetical protein [Ruminococcus sp.]